MSERTVNEGAGQILCRHRFVSIRTIPRGATGAKNRGIGWVVKSRFARVAMILALALTGAGVFSAQAAEYFVSKQGDDHAAGLSEKQALATIGKGMSVLKPGDTLTILPGHYFESVTARISGATNAPVTIRAKRPGTVLMRGDVDVTGFKLADGLRYTYGIDFEKRAEGVADRADLRLYEAVTSVTEVEKKLGSFYQDPSAKRLYVHTVDSAHPDRKCLSVTVTNGFGILLLENVHDVVIDGLVFTGYNTLDLPSEPGSRNRWGLFVANGSERITIRRCTAFLNSGGISLSGSSDAVVEDCYAFANVGRFTGGLACNISVWSGYNTIYRRNLVEGGDLLFYGGARYDKKPPSGLMESNLCINAGIFIKGAFEKDNTFDRNNCVIRGGFFRYPIDPSNLHLADNETAAALRTYVDPIGNDYRLQSDAPNRGKGPNGADPGPFPYRDEVFFVSPQGDDARAGTSLALAWATLAHAARVAQAGQTVYVTEGVYHETLAPVHSGEADKPIRFLRRGRDKVVLEGKGNLEVGIDLQGRAYVEVNGFIVQKFGGAGIRVGEGSYIRLEKLLALDNGGEGIWANKVKGLTIRNSLLRGNKGGGMLLERSPGAAVSGNVFDRNGKGGVACDVDSLEELYSDQNAFSPSARPAAVLAGKELATLAEWQKAAGQDAHSLAVDPGYRDPEAGDYGLRDDSELIGRGPDAHPIGPYLRVSFQAPVELEHLTPHAVTATAATLECWTPKANSAITLEWGETNQIETPVSLTNTPFAPVLFHSVGLIGLKPGKEYTVRVKAKGRTEAHRWAPHAWAKRGAGPGTGQVATAGPGTGPVATVRFKTLEKDAPLRELHVAVKGDDKKSGLSMDEAWRTISHAATEARAGDTVLIHAGTYEETVFMRATGDKERPITFRAAPGETVWMDGSKRVREMAFRLEDKHYICIDGFRFRHFNYLPHVGGCINIANGSGHVVRRCFYDGRELTGYTDVFLRATHSTDLLVENCVMINGMGVGVSLAYCFNANVRHCVFYNNFIQALDIIQWNLPPWDSRMTVNFSHNLVCDTIPEKTANAFIRVSHLDALHSDYNGYFARKGPMERRVVETSFFKNKPLGPAAGKYGYWSHPTNLMLAGVQELAGQEKNSIFGNPGIRAVKELTPSGRYTSEYWKHEMHQEGSILGPLDFADFFCDPNGPMGKAIDGKPIGLDPEAFK